MRRVLVLGAGGALGAATVHRALGEGWHVDASLRPGSSIPRASLLDGARLHRCDLRAAGALTALLAETEPEHVVMAAMEGRHPSDMIARQQQLQDVLAMQLALATALRTVGFRGVWVNLGSYSVYGGDRGVRCAPDAAIAPCVFRGAVKAAESVLARQLATESGLRLVELRVFCAWGRWMAHDRLLTQLLRAALGGPSVRLAPTPLLRDWVHHDDIGGACLQATGLPAGPMHVYNLCSGDLTDIRRLAAELGELSGRVLVADRAWPGEDTMRPPAGLPPTAADGFDWQPRVGFARGLRDLWQWATSSEGRAYLAERG